MNTQTHIRSHNEIIEEAGGYEAVADALDLPRERVRFWQRRQSIPHPYWSAVAERFTFTGLSELALSAAQKRQSA